MSTVNVQRNEAESTVVIFDNFYKKQIKINAAEYDQINAYFRSTLGEDLIANDFTAVIFEIANGYDQSPLELLDSIKGQTGVELSATLAYYLNGLRSKTTLLGVTAIQQPNVYAARNVLV